MSDGPFFWVEPGTTGWIREWLEDREHLRRAIKKYRGKKWRKKAKPL